MLGPYQQLNGETGGHQFRNPLDELDYIAQNTSTDNGFRNKPLHVTSSISNENLMNGYVFVDRPPHSRASICSEGILVDLSNGETNNLEHQQLHTKPSKSSSSSDYATALLMKELTGIKYEKRQGKWSHRIVQLVPGMLLRNMDDINMMKPELEQWHHSRRDKPNSMCAPMEELVNGLICAMVTSSDIMSITHEQAHQLISVSEAKRIELYNDLERFNFVLGLKVGHRVLVDVPGEMSKVPAHVSWIGDRPDRDGIWYKVDFETDSPWSNQSHERLNREFESNWNSSYSGMSGSSSVAQSNSRNFYAPNQLHMPLKGGGVPTLYDNRRRVPFNNEDDFRIAGTASKQTRERIIPITRKEENNGEVSRQSRSRQVENEYNQQLQLNHNDVAPPGYSMSLPPNSYSQPSRSRSVHSMPVGQKKTQGAVKNEAIGDDYLGFRVGDSCVWNNGTSEEGTIHYIGYLKGHRGLYAGVEFKNRIGAGTGMFNKEQLFMAREGHAGFIELSSLDAPSSSSAGYSNHSTVPVSSHRRRLSSSRSQQIPASAGPSVSVPVNYGRGNKQASIESLSDPPPPPYTPPSPPRSSSAASTHQAPPIPPKPIKRVEDYLINPHAVGSSVKVVHLGAERKGIVRWLGDAMNEEGNGLESTATVQLDADVPPAWRRSCEVHSYTGVPVNGGVLVPVSALRSNRDVPIPSSTSSYQAYSTNQPISSSSGNGRRNGEFGSIDSGVEKQKCVPAKDTQVLIGRQKGIQGYRNSCYIDATLYAMFVQSTVFDFLLEKSIKNKEKGAQFQKLLAHEIVFPLRKFHYVRADHVMKLRELLQELMPHITGLTNEEKDPEEILAFIFSEIFHVEPFIKLIGQKNSTDSQYLVPIVVDSDWQGGAATSQHLLERHMRSAQVRFVKPPPVLIMQLPRYGQQKVFDKILPLDVIDITPFVAGAVPACFHCGACADVYCPTCFLTRRVFFTDIVYCDKCFARSHMLPELEDHGKRDLYPPAKPQKKPNSHKMVLSAVLCIETSHYVAYVRTSSGNWVFFDSMADREGLSDGFNVPVVKECEDASFWLSLNGWKKLKEADDTGQIKAMFGKSGIDPLVGRLLSDSYICFYEDISGGNSSSSAHSTLINTFKNMMP